MAKKETIEDVGKREAREEEDRKKAAENWIVMTEKIAKDVPERFFVLAKQLRECVHRFNNSTSPGKRLMWNESAAVATRDSNLNADFNVRFYRKDAEFTLLLAQLGRTGKPDVFVINGEGQMKDKFFSLRIEGKIDGKNIAYRITRDFKPLEISIEELAERVVLTIVKQDLSQLVD